MGIFSSIVDLFFPPRCIFCGRFLGRGNRYVCKTCRVSLPYEDDTAKLNGADISEVAVPLRYEGSVRKAFHRFKFKGRTGYATPFGEIIAEEVKRVFNGRYDIITWVPVSMERKTVRGYDQSQLLAYAVALELGDVAAETIVKSRHTPAQSELSDRAQRLDNVMGAFDVIDASLVEGKRVLLIDDLLNTGATISECAGVLKRAGAKEVVGAVLARSVAK